VYITRTTYLVRIINSKGDCKKIFTTTGYGKTKNQSRESSLKNLAKEIKSHEPSVSEFRIKYFAHDTKELTTNDIYYSVKERSKA
jgi:hypothetical protein